MISLSARAQMSAHPLAKELFLLMEEKESNLALAADCTSSEELLFLAETLGPEIVVLKTHIDIIADFTPALTETLSTLAKKHRFLLFEDRKFADIGQTVLEQYRGGLYHMADWAHLVNAHLFPGPGIVEGLKKGRRSEQSGLLLLTEMSSSGSLRDPSLSLLAKQMAETHPDFVIGFIAQHKVSDNPGLLTFTPGIQLASRGDTLGQRYKTPREALSSGSDILIVGRGITGAPDPLAAARFYREEAWCVAR